MSEVEVTGTIADKLEPKWDICKDCIGEGFLPSHTNNVCQTCKPFDGEGIVPYGSPHAYHRKTPVHIDGLDPAEDGRQAGLRANAVFRAALDAATPPQSPAAGDAIERAKAIWREGNAAALDACEEDRTMDAEECRQGQYDDNPSAKAFIAVIAKALSASPPSEGVEALREALEQISGYEWPVIVGQHKYTTVGQATGREYKHSSPIAAETALQALNSVKSIAREALARLAPQGDE